VRGWVAIVGSRTIGECSCTVASKSHAKPGDCPRVQALQFMLRVITRLAKDPDFVGIVSGEAKGADTYAKEAAKILGVRYEGFTVNPGRESFATRAKWRNDRIVQHASGVVAVFAAGPRSRGTSDTVAKAKAAGLPVHVFHEGHWSEE